MRPSMEMTVSAAMTIAGPTARAATSSAFASARRWTCASGDSPGKGVSSTVEERTTKEKPASRRISARRVEAESGDTALFFGNEVVHADDNLFLFLDGALEFVSGFLDLSLNEAAFNGAQHPTHGVDFFDVSDGASFDFVGKVLDGVGAGHGV